LRFGRLRTIRFARKLGLRTIRFARKLGLRTIRFARKLGLRRSGVHPNPFLFHRQYLIVVRPAVDAGLRTVLSFSTFGHSFSYYAYFFYRVSANDDETALPFRSTPTGVVTALPTGVETCSQSIQIYYYHIARVIKDLMHH
jgi:hypothetical protein